MSKKRKRTKRKRSPVEVIGFLAVGAFVVGLIWLALFTSPNPPNQTTTTTARTSSLAFDFVATDVDGRPFRLSEYRGKVVVLDFMRTTCPACISEEAHLRELRSKFGSDVVTVMVSTAGDTENVLRNHRDQNMPGWIAIIDTTNLSRAYSVQATPTIFVIDRNGYVAYQHVGVTEASILISEVNSVR